MLSQTESIDEFGTLEWQLVLSLFIAWTVVCLVLLRGIQSLGKVNNVFGKLFIFMTERIVFELNEIVSQLVDFS